MKRILLGTSIFAALLAASSCSVKKAPLEKFYDSQRSRVIEGSAYIQADFDFWGAIYEPTREDLEALRAAWVEHGEAFPDSKAYGEVERETNKSGQKTLLVGLFMTAWENADLKDKGLGWSVYPVPSKVTELAENDVVLRTLMPVRNPWARYFLLRYSPQILEQSSKVVLSNRTSRIELKRAR